MSAAGGCLRFLAKLHSCCASLRGPRCREPFMGVEPTLFSAERLLAQPTGRFAPHEPANAQDQSRDARRLHVWFKLSFVGVVSRIWIGVMARYRRCVQRKASACLLF
jgi:hypothetical protein